MRVGNTDIVEPVLRYTNEYYTFGVNTIVDCGELGFFVLDDRGLAIGSGPHPDIAKIDVWARIAEYLKVNAPYVEEYWIEYENEEQFSEM